MYEAVCVEGSNSFLSEKLNSFSEVFSYFSKYSMFQNIKVYSGDLIIAQVVNGKIHLSKV